MSFFRGLTKGCLAHEVKGACGLRVAGVAWVDLPYSGITSSPLGEQVWMCSGHDAFKALGGEGGIGLAVSLPGCGTRNCVSLPAQAF